MPTPFRHSLPLPVIPHSFSPRHCEKRSAVEEPHRTNRPTSHCEKRSDEAIHHQKKENLYEKYNIRARRYVRLRARAVFKGLKKGMRRIFRVRLPSVTRNNPHGRRLFNVRNLLRPAASSPSNAPFNRIYSPKTIPNAKKPWRNRATAFTLS